MKPTTTLTSKITSALTLLLATALQGTFQAPAPSGPSLKLESLNKIPLGYGNLSVRSNNTKDTNTQSTSKTSNIIPQFGFLWNTQIAAQNVTMKIDFNMADIYIGDLSKSSDWGIDCNSTANATGPATCIIDTSSPLDNVEVYKVTTTGYAGKAALVVKGLDTDYLSNISLVTNVRAKWPFSGGYGVVGLGPFSNFWKFLIDVSKQKDNLTLLVNISSKGDLSSDLQGRAAINFQDSSLLIQPNMTGVEFKTVEATNITSQVFSSWAFKGLEAELPYTPWILKDRFGLPANPDATPMDGAKNINLISVNELICIVPDLEAVMVLNPKTKQDQFNQLNESLHGTICKKANAKTHKNLNSKCYDIGTGPTITMTLANQSLDLGPFDYIYHEKGYNVPLLGMKLDDAPFVSGPCANAQVALGRNFFTKYKLYMDLTYKDKVQDSSMKIGFVPQQPPAEDELTTKQILLIVGAVVLSIILAFVLIGCCGRKDERAPEVEMRGKTATMRVAGEDAESDGYKEESGDGASGASDNYVEMNV